MKITVFTPTYNRAYIIGKLYESLCRQTFKDFEWLVVDDGSTDETGTLIAKFIDEGKITIRYFKQANGGKHRAINFGVPAAQGELFFIVDSDDFLEDNALERINFHYQAIKDDETFAGVSGLRRFPDGSKIGGEENWKIVDATFAEARWKSPKIRGDLAEAYKTKILKQFPFPEIPGEKFCPEMLVWYQIARQYKLRFFYEKIYVCEYLPDGLSAKIKKHCAKNPAGTSLSYLEKFRNCLSIKQKIKCALQYWRYSFIAETSFFKSAKTIGFAGTLFAPAGWILAKLTFK